MLYHRERMLHACMAQYLVRGRVTGDQEELLLYNVAYFPRYRDISLS